MGVTTPSLDEPGHKKIPEMNELETDKIPLKIWAHNFEKQKKLEQTEIRNPCEKISSSGDWNSYNIGQKWRCGTPCRDELRHKKDSGNERIRNRQNYPENLSS